MDCPVCKTDLKPAKLDNDLPAMQCESCAGNFISLLVYRSWSERHPSSCNSAQHAQSHDVSAEETAKGLLCPKCGRIMQKFKISAQSDHKIDLCTSCDEAWLDGGEWQLLKTLELANKLTSIITAPWQLKIKQEVSAQHHELRWQQTLGDDDYRKARELKDWLKSHPNSGDLYRFINEQ